ncbi:MAG: DsbA family protein [Chitinophagaceae bacterium]
MKPKIIYCYDAYCGWCYGFSDVIKKLWGKHKENIDFETLSGGMIPVEATQHIGAIASYIKDAYKTVENASGVKFGKDYLWHINHPEESDWYPNSEMASIAMAVFRDIHPELTVPFASDLQHALHYEGRDLTDKEAYRHLVERYQLDEEDFYKKLSSEEYKEKAYYDFTLTKQLRVNGFPTVFLQLEENKLYMIARGFSDFDSVENRINNIFAENNIQ